MQTQTKKQCMTTKTIASCALLAALNIVLARLIGLMPNASSRFSIEAVPVFLAGMLFGPLAGGMVGFSADFVGCLFSGLGYNPLFCVPPILYGVFGGVFRRFLSGNVTIFRLLISFLPPVVLGSILYQSATLSYIYFKGPFMEGLIYFLSTRSIQFAITMLLDTVIIYILFRSGIFERLGYWPLKSANADQ